MTIVTNLAGGTNDVPLNLALTNLNGNTTYCFRMVASNSFGKVFGTNHVFTTPIPPPYASTLPATLITGNGAVLNARVNPNGTSTEVWFEFGTQTGYYPFGSFGNTNIGSGSSELLIGASIPTWRPLQPATLYHYRVGARNSGGTRYGADASFTTTGSQPLAAVQYPSLVTVSNALFNGAVNPNGETTAAWYEWGITTNYGRFVTIPYSNGRFTNLWFEGSAPVNYDRITPPKAVGSGTSYASAGSMVNDLTPGTMYEYRLVASNRFGQVTNGYAWCPVPAPQVVVEPATAVTGSSAILHAQVNPNGWPVTAWFQWGLNGIENRSAPIYLSPRTNPVPLSLYVTGLVSGVTYGYYQVMVTNGAFNTFGGWSFTTPIPPTVTTLSATAVSHTNATLKGSVNPKSLPTRAWFEWGLSTNYAHRTSSVEVGAGNTNVPVATYHFRFVAESPGGVVHGPDATFTTLPPPVASDGYYVSRTLLPEGLSTPITITTTGGNHFYQGAIPRPFRIRLTQNGQPFNLIEPESVWPQSLTFMFPPLDPGYYGFVIQTQYPLSGWGDYYESGPRFFKVERYVAAQVGTPHSFQLAARNSTMEQVNPTEFIPTATYTLSNVITGTIAVRQHVNAGLNMPWLADIWKSGENGVKLSFDFILDDYVMFKFGIPIVITFDFPTIVAQGQLVEAKAPSVSYPGGEWLRAEHNVYYSTDHNLWLNAPFDGLPPVDISLSQKDDKLLIWGSVPTLPGCDAISRFVGSALDSNARWGRSLG
jgi:hypothetical protein